VEIKKGKTRGQNLVSVRPRRVNLDLQADCSLTQSYLKLFSKSSEKNSISDSSLSMLPSPSASGNLGGQIQSIPHQSVKHNALKETQRQVIHQGAIISKDYGISTVITEEINEGAGNNKDRMKERKLNEDEEGIQDDESFGIAEEHIDFSSRRGGKREESDDPDFVPSPPIDNG